MWGLLPSIEYPAAGKGYWGPVTSTLNWCEEVSSHQGALGIQDDDVSLTRQIQDYYATVYSAEIVNTLTNALFVVFALKGLRNCFQHNHDTVFVVTFLGYMLVGLGSFAFHASLKCTSHAPCRRQSCLHTSLTTVLQTPCSSSTSCP